MCLNTSGAANNSLQDRKKEEGEGGEEGRAQRTIVADDQERERRVVPSCTSASSRLHQITSAMEAAAAAAAAAAKLNSSPSVDYTPRSSPPSSLTRTPPPSAPRSASPPTLVPSAMSMVSMASMLGAHHPPFGLPVGYPGARDDFTASMHKFMERSFGDSPPPTVPSNDPTANECKIVDYRGEKVAAFAIQVGK